ncbi:MAG: bifunctional precorrin-2 dehydrogenase/sirohydrochlorin ferrochelatase [Nitrospirota bacterium]
MTANPGFPISLDVKGWPCLVLGGDEEAAEKTLRLLDAGAKVTVVNPTLNDTLRKLTASAKVIHRVRTFRTTDVESVILVLNVLRGDRDFARSLLDLARERRFLVWSIDEPTLSNVMMPAVVSRGHLRVAISTSGASPALASRLRQDLEQIFGEEFSAFLDWLADLRDETKATEADAERRRMLLREAVNGFKFTGSIEYPKAWLEQRQKA